MTASSAVAADRPSAKPADPRFAVQFVDGYHRALQVGAAILLTGAVVSVLTSRRSEPQAQAIAEPAVSATSAWSST